MSIKVTVWNEYEHENGINGLQISTRGGYMLLSPTSQ